MEDELGVLTLYWQKSRTFPRLSWTPMNNFPGPVQSLRMFKNKGKTAFTYNIQTQTVVHCRKFSIKQNADVSCSKLRWTYLHMVSTYAACFPFEPLEKCIAFEDIFPRLSRTLSFNFHDSPGPKRFSTNFQVLEFSRKKSRTFREALERCYKDSKSRDPYKFVTMHLTQKKWSIY